jgi:hypothetical protein
MTRLLLALALLASAQDKGPRRLEWKLGKDRAALYGGLDRSGRPSRDRDFLLLAAELKGTGNRIVVERQADLPLAFVFQLPADPVKSGLPPWELSATLFADASDATAVGLLGGGEIRPIAVRGRFAVKSLQKKADDEIVTIDGAFTFFEIRRDFVNNQVSLVPTKNDVGTLATSAQFSVNRGLVVRAGWQLRLKGQERENGRVVDRRLDLSEGLELKEELDLAADPAPAAHEVALTKAVDWLRRQQKPAGSWGQPAQGQAADLGTTGLVVRALLAAGVEASDPLLAPSVKLLRGAGAPDTWGLSNQIAAIALKGPDKAEADDLRKLVDELVRRRDARSGLWPAGTGGRNDPLNPVSTGYALEALSHVPDARVPDDAWKAALDQLAAAALEGAREIDLELEWEADAAPDLAAPGKVAPVVWPGALAPRQPNDPLQLRAARRGSSLTQLAVLRALLAVPERQRAEERTRKFVDATVRKGLAQVQGEWTLRAVPPVEGAWSQFRGEYLSLLSQVLSRAKLVRIAGSDWRLDGAALLVREQAEDGSFGDGSAARTAQALLFLATARRR